MDLADKIIQAVNSSREQINQVAYGKIEIKVADGNDVDIELNQKIKPLREGKVGNAKAKSI